MTSLLTDKLDDIVRKTMVYGEDELKKDIDDPRKVDIRTKERIKNTEVQYQPLRRNKIRNSMNTRAKWS